VATSAGIKAGRKIFDLPPVVFEQTGSLAKQRIALMSQWGVRLYPWQSKVVRQFGGRNRPRVGYVQTPRKNGKTMLGVALALTEMVLLPGRHIYLVSDSERSLRSVMWRELLALFHRSLTPHVVEYHNRLVYPANGSEIQIIAGNFAASQGINPHLVVYDEVHLQKDDRSWNGMLVAGAARRDALLLGITTPGYQLDSLARNLYSQVRSGDLSGLIWEPVDHDADIQDREQWAKANPCYRKPGFRAAMEHDLIHMPEHDFRRFRLGLWTASDRAWLPSGAWEACTGGAETKPGSVVWLGFDGSYSGDSTALVAVDEKRHATVLGHWLPTNGSRVPVIDVENAIRKACRDYRVQAVACDPYRWQRSLQVLADEGLPMIEYPQRPARMIPATQDLYEAILGGAITHGGDPRLQSHLLSCQVRVSAAGVQVCKEHPDSARRIDLAVALIMAHSLAVISPKNVTTFSDGSYFC